MTMFSRFSVFLALCCSSIALAANILLTNDDGWAVANIRAQYADLQSAGYNVVLSCPAENESGAACEYDTCPTGSPAEGYNSSDPFLNYVNAYSVDSARYGIQTLAPTLFDAEPDFVVSGPNVGSNTGTTVSISGTVGAATEAAIEGYPATAFSGRTGSQKSYTELYSDPSSSTSESAWIYAALTVQYTDALLASGASPLLPAGIIVNVNYPSTSDCSDASDYEWVFARNLAGSGTDASVVDTDGCYASVSVLNATTKADVDDASLQGEVYAILAGLPFSCLPSSSSQILRSLLGLVLLTCHSKDDG
ncbi:hypothetical protein FOMPIDRAFT_1031218 [Fomitopsis schrenkii]|uniref:Survival protein SurE-like phosphatase/nucleotidase domain-containing protein n=1 Tax=Fomitopsis schrenkii TaxID=2126942 RepID=S8FKT9_FOMSC|nr:hypothetical protein FOMPIDRAFT_1031218 [Fomitopsis schrenkii]